MEFNMTFPRGSRALVAVAFAAALLGGCTRVVDHQGYLVDEPLVAAIQPGVDNRESVQGTLGRPTFVGQFDQSDWYYVSRTTRQLAFNMPRPHEQTVLRVHFDASGNVESVTRSGLELVSNIDPSNEKTPTLGSHSNLLQELFGNIGAVGQAGRSAPTSDNPNGR
ncbi:MAG: outer membrane protein assembly factor BamE [Alphaproteobacteria bacterium]|nr:MAG: outer membrane protein assembly factor BamE [Alphaproteobacteria bacterium]